MWEVTNPSKYHDRANSDPQKILDKMVVESIKQSLAREIKPITTVQFDLVMYLYISTAVLLVMIRLASVSQRHRRIITEVESEPDEDDIWNLLARDKLFEFQDAEELHER